MQVLDLSLLVLLAAAQQCVSLHILDALGKGATAINEEVVRDVNDAINPALQFGMTTVGRQCSIVKKILNLDYDSTNGTDREPDPCDLSIVFTNRDIHATIPLCSAVDELPRLFNGNLSSVQLKGFAHGFTDNPSKNNFQIVNDAYRSTGEYAVVALDASSFIKWLYLLSSTFVQFIGTILGTLLAKLHEAGLPRENIHMVGHSLGAQICGFAGKQFELLTGKKIARITGLDPAGPCFAEVNETLRLKSTDAEFVDVIHSNAGVFGINEKSGHVDFIPNGGAQQPGCLVETCSHSFSVALFAESIRNPDSFPAVPCSNYSEFTDGICKSDVINYMGEGAVPSDEGYFCLQTNGKSPLAKGMDGITYVNTDGIIRKLQNSVVHLFEG